MSEISFAKLTQLLAETRISFTQLAQEQDVSIPTVWRWWSRGIKGIRLDAFNVGAKKFTTREAFERWIARINGEQVQCRSSRQRAADHDSAKATLAAAGIG